MSTTRNPRSGIPALCSDQTREPLPGTARTGARTLALEHPRGWGRDILDGEALGAELSAQVKSWLKANRAQLQFIRRPGREGQKDHGSVTLFIADASTAVPVLEKMELAGPEELTQVDLSTPGHTPGAEKVSDPLLLVCTHGRRDRCCAVKGRPTAAALARKFPGLVWESSHTKGHRFAPSMILLPWNYSFGTLDADRAVDMFATVLAGELPVEGNRGRGTLGAPGQVAELAVAEVLRDAGRPAAPGELVVEPGPDSPQSSSAGKSGGRAATKVVHVTRPAVPDSGGQARTWSVTLESQRCYPVVSSCGDRPKEGKSWVAVSVAGDVDDNNARR